MQRLKGPISTSKQSDRDSFAFTKEEKVNAPVAEFRLRCQGEMVSTKQPEPACDGGPLAVCVNDCQLDYGQASSELIRICFQVQCAFAEMRWGRDAAAAFVDTNVADDEQPTDLNKTTTQSC